MVVASLGASIRPSVCYAHFMGTWDDPHWPGCCVCVQGCLVHKHLGSHHVLWEGVGGPSSPMHL